MSNGYKTILIAFVCFLSGMFVTYAYFVYEEPVKSQNTDVPIATSVEESPEEECAHNTEDEVFTCYDTANKVAVSDIERALSKLKETHIKDEPKLWKMLDHSQEIWRQYRTANCDIETFYSQGGTAFDTYQTQCLLKENRDRALYLQSMIENP